MKLRKHYREIYGGVSRKPRRRNTKASFYSRDSNPVLILIPFTTLNRVRLWAKSYVLPVRRPFNFGFPIFRKTRETRTFRKLRDKFSMNFKNRPGVSRCVRINVFLTWLDTTWWINPSSWILISQLIFYFISFRPFKKSSEWSILVNINIAALFSISFYFIFVSFLKK